MTIVADDRFAVIDFDEFHLDDLPRRLAAGNGALAAPALTELAPLAIRVVGRATAYTYVPVAGGVEVVAGDELARSVVELDEAGFVGLVNDLETVPGMLYRDRVTKVRGNPMRFVGWEAALRAMYHGRPVFDPSAPIVAADGQAVDPERTFSLADTDPDMGRFLHATGYLVVKAVFSPEEVAEMRAAADRLEVGAVEGDRASWWGRNEAGDSILTRVLTGGREPALRSLYADQRLLRLAGLSEFELTPRAVTSDHGVTVLWKRAAMTEGLADIPWHRDCGMGGHAINCPLLIATVCLTDGSAAAGELRALPGSWTSSVNFMDPSQPEAPEGVGLATTAGDVSFHYSDVMHASLPPTGPGPHRISALVAFVPPDAGNHHREERTYNDPLLKRDDGQVEHLRNVVDRL